MRKLTFLTALLGIATACPKVEKKVYSFDLKAKTGLLTFENIVTDSPETGNNDFMDIVNKVIRGDKLEAEHPGWNISDKKLYENEGHLDGKMSFSFTGPSAAGLYKHDKKSPYIWCASRDDDETILSTNGMLIVELPGCVAWDRKQTQLSVTVRTASLTGGEQPLTEQFKRWSAGEELELTDNSLFGGAADGEEAALEGLGDAIAEAFASGIADGIAGDSTLRLGPAKPIGASQADADQAIGSVQQATLKICAAAYAADKKPFSETLVVSIEAGGSYTVSTKDSTGAEPKREKCYFDALEKADFGAHDQAWSIEYPVAVEL